MAEILFPLAKKSLFQFKANNNSTATRATDIPQEKACKLDVFIGFIVNPFSPPSLYKTIDIS